MEKNIKRIIYVCVYVCVCVCVCVYSRLFVKYTDAGKDWRQKEKLSSVDEMVR